MKFGGGSRVFSRMRQPGEGCHASNEPCLPSLCLPLSLDSYHLWYLAHPSAAAHRQTQPASKHTHLKVDLSTRKKIARIYFISEKGVFAIEDDVFMINFRYFYSFQFNFSVSLYKCSNM